MAGIIQAFIIRPFIVSGTSMDPVIQNGPISDRDEVTYHLFHTPERGDVIVSKAPPEPTKYILSA